jgi:hypothetical protein
MEKKSGFAKEKKVSSPVHNVKSSQEGGLSIKGSLAKVHEER